VTTIFAVCSVLACVAWIAAEAKVGRVRQQRDDVRASYQSLQREHEHTTRELRAKRVLLMDALALVPDTPRGRELGAAIGYRAWEQRNQDRLVSHLQLVDRRPAS